MVRSQKDRIAQGRRRPIDVTCLRYKESTHLVPTCKSGDKVSQSRDCGANRCGTTDPRMSYRFQKSRLSAQRLRFVKVMRYTESAASGSWSKARNVRSPQRQSRERNRCQYTQSEHVRFPVMGMTLSGGPKPQEVNGHAYTESAEARSQPKRLV